MPPKQPTSADPAGSEPRDAAAPGADRPDTAGPDTEVLDAVPADEPDEPGDAAAPGKAKSVPPLPPAPGADPVRAARVRRLVIIAVVAVLLLAAATLLAVGNHVARTSGALGNEALVDSDDTAEVVSQVTAAVKTVYSYDYKSLDRNEADARAVITGDYADEFERVFTPVKQLAPKEQAVLETVVPAAGVMQLRGDNAQLLMMVDQRGTRIGGQPLPATSARLVVEAQKVDGRWKIAKVTPE